MQAIVGIIVSNWRIVGWVALLASISYAAWWLRESGIKAERAHWEHKVADAHEQRRLDIEQHAKKLNAQIEQIRAENETLKTKRQTVTKTLIKEVPVYVSKADDNRCVINAGFVQHHDDAAAGRVSAVSSPASDLAGRPSGIALSHVAETVAVNYGQCIQWRDEVIAFRKWYDSSRARHDAFTANAKAKD